MSNEFSNRFVQFSSIDNILELLSNPLTTDLQGEWRDQLKFFFPTVDVCTIQLEMSDLQAERPDINDVLKFWSRSCTYQKYPALFDLGIRLLTMFGSTYICESIFSNINYIKNKHRNRLNQEHLENLLMVATTSMQVDFDDILKDKTIFQTSH